MLFWTEKESEERDCQRLSLLMCMLSLVWQNIVITFDGRFMTEGVLLGVDVIDDVSVGKISSSLPPCTDIQFQFRIITRCTRNLFGSMLDSNKYKYLKGKEMKKGRTGKKVKQESSLFYIRLHTLILQERIPSLGSCFSWLPHQLLTLVVFPDKTRIVLCMKRKGHDTEKRRHQGIHLGDQGNGVLFERLLGDNLSLTHMERKGRKQRHWKRHVFVSENFWFFHQKTSGKQFFFRETAAAASTACGSARMRWRKRDAFLY